MVSVAAVTFVGFLVKEEGLGNRDSQALIGTWKLIDEQTILPDGTVITQRGFSATTGILVYDASGHVASQVFRPNAVKQATSANLDTPREYEGYFGTYAVDWTKETITCHMGAALPSEDEGQDRTEQFSLAGGKLTTRSRPHRTDGTVATHLLVWTRLN